MIYKATQKKESRDPGCCQRRVQAAEAMFVGGDRKIFTLTRIAQQALNEVGRDNLKTEMTHRIYKADSTTWPWGGIIREYVLDSRLSELAKLNKNLSFPDELGGIFLPRGVTERFEIMFIAEMPSMNEPFQISPTMNHNFDVTTRDRFFQAMMSKYGVAGSYVTDVVKRRDRPRKPTKAEITQWLPFLLREIKIIQPRGVVVLGKRTYDETFKDNVEPHVPTGILIDWVFHYSSQVTRAKFEGRFKDVVSKMMRTLEIESRKWQIV